MSKSKVKKAVKSNNNSEKESAMKKQSSKKVAVKTAKSEPKAKKLSVITVKGVEYDVVSGHPSKAAAEAQAKVVKNSKVVTFKSGKAAVCVRHGEPIVAVEPAAKKAAAKPEVKKAAALTPEERKRRAQIAFAIESANDIASALKSKAKIKTYDEAKAFIVKMAPKLTADSLLYRETWEGLYASPSVKLSFNPFALDPKGRARSSVDLPVIGGHKEDEAVSPDAKIAKKAEEEPVKVVSLAKKPVKKAVVAKKPAKASKKSGK